MKHRFHPLCVTMLAIAICCSSSLAQDRRKRVSTPSAETANAAPESSESDPTQQGFAVPLFVQGVANVGDKTIVTVENRDTGERFVLKTGEEGPNGIKLVGVALDTTTGQPQVKIQKGDEFAILGIDLGQSPAPLGAQSEFKGKTVGRMDYPNANVQSVLSLYGTLTGREVVSDSSVQGNLSIVTTEPLPVARAVKHIETALILNGFSIVLHGDKSVHVLGPGKPTRSDSIPIYYDEKAIPEGVSIISFVFRLNHLDARELANTLNQYLATGSPYTSFLATPGPNHLLVTETTSTIRNLIPLVRSLDIPEPADVTRLKLKIAQLEQKLAEK